MSAAGEQHAVLEIRRLADAREAPPPGPGVVARLAATLRRQWLLVLVVVLPMLVAGTYLLLVASDVYEAETHFVVRSASGSSGLGSITTMMPTTSFSRSNDDTHSVNAFIVSRDGIDRLIRDYDLLEKLAPPGADFLQRFPRPFERRTREALHKRYGDFVSVAFDSGTGISMLRVRAFRPEDARQIALALLQHSEELINRLNERARADSITFASDVVDRAEKRVAQAQERIAAFRAAELVFDPARQSVATFELMSVLFLELAQLKANLAETAAAAPNSPQVVALQARVRAYEKQIEEQRRAITGGDDSLAPKLARYEQLALERELATKALTSALASLESARSEAQRQQLYLERVVAPALPDQPRYPRRLPSALGLLLVLMCVYAILRWLGEVVMEHNVR